ncbi:MAG: aminopeptidase [Nitrososphaerota archaeon]|jgi:leucyl aminopeptidase (aminopeptidase T)|nr:aminopeptidase [Nitrososphaerota archaeon]MDG6903825.1 aminopeptidase [Nitrososphaerota archaeon]MDG6911543.1 aminopeptidase [Nitrososphaerota archaeon]MDG6940445.1 aminopeptidase [Nitrososphaerota archaeon]MDG6960758.1 aminopeptidase [Nitrososphaerota archaeon]
MSTDSLDSLYTKVAKKVLAETLQVKKGESVTVETWDNGVPFARRAVAEARAMGCTAVTIYEDEAAYVEGVRRAPADVVGSMGRNEYGILSGTDAYIFIPGQAIGPYSKTLKPEEKAQSTRYNSSWYEAAEKSGLRGARLSFGYVGEDTARLLGKKIHEVVRAQLKAALVDLRRISSSAERVSPLLADGASAELTSGKATLTFTLKGDFGIEDGVVDESDKKAGNNMTYMPPGFVSKEIDPGSANGSVILTDTLTEHGVIPRITLEFKNGKVESWESSSRAMVKRMFESVSPDQRELKLLLIGLNPEMPYGMGQDRFVRGSITLGGFGFRGQVKNGSLKASGRTAVARGKLAP